MVHWYTLHTIVTHNADSIRNRKIYFERRVFALHDNGKNWVNAIERMNGKFNVEQNSYLGCSISFGDIHMFTLHLKFQTQGNKERKRTSATDTTRGSMRKITSGAITPISPGIFNYLFIHTLRPARAHCSLLPLWCEEPETKWSAWWMGYLF